MKRDLKLRQYAICTAICLLLTFMLMPATSVMAEPPAEGIYNAQTETTYTSLEDAISNATSGDTLKVYGTVKVPGDTGDTATISIDKNITLVAGGDSAKLEGSRPDESSTPMASLLKLTNDASLTLGREGTPELLMEKIHLKVDAGKLQFQDGVHLRSNAKASDPGLTSTEALSIVSISGSSSSASFTGGTIENPEQSNNNNFHNNYLVSISGGAKVDTISGGSYKGAYISFNVYGAGTKVANISGGTFENSRASGQSEPAFKLWDHARIESISGGTFTSYRFGALQLESGATVGTISGGTFKNPLDPLFPFPRDFDKDFASGLVLYSRLYSGDTSYVFAGDKDPVRVDTISGGTFSGANGLFCIGDKPEHKAQIGTISGGSFSGDDAGIQFNQSSSAEFLKGKITATGKRFGLLSFGKINEISGGLYKGKEYDGLSLQDWSLSQSGNKDSKGSIDTISGGSFIGDRNGLLCAGKIKMISGGYFEGERYAVHYRDYVMSGVKAEAELEKIDGGAFRSKGRECIYLDKRMGALPNINLESGLSDTQPPFGKARFYAPNEKDIFKDERLVNFPTYKHKGTGETLTYFISDSSDTKDDVPEDPKSGYRFLRRLLMMSYDINLDENSEPQIALYAKPGDTPTLWTSMPEGVQIPENMEFLSWNTKKDGSGSSYAPGAVIPPMYQDMIFYAQWKKNTPPTETTKPSQSTEPSATATEPSATDTKPSSTEATSSETTPDKQEVIITYDLNGGILDGQTAPIQEVHQVGDIISIRQAPTRPGYTFSHWEGSRYYPGDQYEVVGDHTFQAIWDPIAAGHDDFGGFYRPSGDEKLAGNPTVRIVQLKTDQTPVADKQKQANQLPRTGEESSVATSAAAFMFLIAGVLLILRRRKRSSH